MNDPFETGIHTGICGFIHMDVVCLLLLFGYVSFHSIASHSVSWQILNGTLVVWLLLWVIMALCTSLSACFAAPKIGL